MANLFFDDFNRSDDTDLGADWDERKGSWAIASNTLTSTGGTNYCAHTVTVFSTADYIVSATVNYNSGAIFRVGGRRVDYSTDDSNSYLLTAREGDQDLKLYKRISDVWTQLGSTISITVNTSTDYILKLSMNGTTIKAYWDGVEKISVTDSALSSAGNASCEVGASASGYFDDFSVDDFATGNPYYYYTQQ